MTNGPLLSVIVPVFNEERSLDESLQRLVRLPIPNKEIIAVDDGSRDGSAAILARWASVLGVRVVSHPVNRGKGAAVRTGLALCQGHFSVVQDADLEYDPDDLLRVLEPLVDGRADVVYGSRYLAPTARFPWTRFRTAVSLLNGLVRVLYGYRLTDEATCYKAMPTALWRALDLQSDRFELCAEITAKVCRRRLRLREVPISYHPRTAAEGKKINWRDAWPTVWALVKWRFVRRQNTPLLKRLS